MTALEQLKEELQQLEQQRTTTQTRIGQLTIAIDALEGKPVSVKVVHVEGPTIPDIAMKAIEQMSSGVVFDHQSLKDKMLTLYPDPVLAEKIKHGVYSAVSWMLKHNKIERAPGGFKPIRAVTTIH